MEILAAIALALLVFVLVKRIAKKRARPGARPSEVAVEKWARAEVARLIAERLNVEEAELASTLGGNPDPDLVTRLERTILSVEVCYERALGANGSADVRVDVKLENGGLERSEKRIPWSELPAHVRDEFAATGTAHVYRPWLFPWQR